MSTSIQDIMKEVRRGRRWSVWTKDGCISRLNERRLRSKTTEKGREEDREWKMEKLREEKRRTNYEVNCENKTAEEESKGINNERGCW